ncbi:hypothetical protein D4764_0258600 [Takifugu flavidus]|uniref:Uncharacterized protein n=1 Tax=Takifugu flavidus TaxID=433684 RepID=A0A5C6MEQ3_9TELE|nr:hypothetical protein D4764_0258600 [Takifugu flavidus]
MKPEETEKLVKLQTRLKDIKSWMPSNFLLLNSGKTEVMVFGPEPLRDRLDHMITLDGISLTSSLSAGLPVHLLSGCPNNSLRSLQLIQNAAARVLTGIGKRDYITPVLRGLAPSYLEELVIPYQPNRLLRSQNAGLLVVPRLSRSRMGGRAFSYQAPLLWNQLPVLSSPLLSSPLLSSPLLIKQTMSRQLVHVVSLLHPAGGPIENLWNEPSALTRLMELKNTEELEASYNNIVHKYSDPPILEEHGDQSPFQVNELLDVNTMLQNLNNDNYLLSPGPERGYGSGKEEMTFQSKDRGEYREKEVLQDNGEEIIWMQNLYKKMDSLKEQLDRAENLKCFSITTIEELQEQKEALQEKVKMIEMRQNNTKPKMKMQTGKQRREQTVKLLEQEEWKEHCTFLNRQMCEAKDRVDFLEEQLNLTKWTSDFFKTIIDKILEDRDSLSGRKKILMVRINSTRSKLSRCFYRIFWPKEKWHKEDINLLIRKKNEIKAKSLDLKEQLEYATHFYNIHEGSVNRLSQEIEQLESKLNDLKEWLRKDESSLFKRKKETEDDVAILQKQEREVKLRLKGLRKKLAEVQGSQNCYSSFIASIQEKQEELDKKMKIIEDKLLKGMSERRGAGLLLCPVCVHKLITAWASNTLDDEAPQKLRRLSLNLMTVLRTAGPGHNQRVRNSLCLDRASRPGQTAHPPEKI